jgi:hypothetical protein
MNKPKPDAEELARNLPWHICGIRAEMRHLHLQFGEFLASETGDEASKIRKKMDEACLERQKILYSLTDILALN